MMLLNNGEEYLIRKELIKFSLLLDMNYDYDGEDGNINSVMIKF